MDKVINYIYRDSCWLYEEYTINQRSSYDIARECNVAVTTIIKYLNRFGIHIRTKHENAMIKPSPGFTGHKHSEESKEKTRQKLIGRVIPVETRIKLSASLRGRTFTEETIQKMRDSCVGKRFGSNNPNWRGGTSFKPYCQKFDKHLKEDIRNKYDRKCAACGKPETEICTKLPVHHIDYDKMQGCNNRRWLLAPLCYSCHMRSTFHKFYFFNLLVNNWAMNINYNFDGMDLFVPKNIYVSCGFV